MVTVMVTVMVTDMVTDRVGVGPETVDQKMAPWKTGRQAVRHTHTQTSMQTNGHPDRYR